MSKPRHIWWGYAKNMIRKYPEYSRELSALKETSVTVNFNGVGGGSLPSDPTGSAAIRELPFTKQREYEAVKFAASRTSILPDGDIHLRLIRLIYWDKTHTLEGAALACNVSSATARRWHGDFIRLVATAYGLCD